MLLDGPRRRGSRILRFEAITNRLRGAWQGCTDPTGVAAQVRVDVGYLELALSDPRYIAVMATDTLVSLAHELHVPLSALDPEPTFFLPIPAVRALMAAADRDGWDDATIRRLMFEGRALLERGDNSDLKTMTAWRRLRRTIS
jgi:hypothetical protein